MLIRQATLDDRAAIHEFIRTAYADRAQYKIPERWQWQFVDNPFWSGPGLPIWIAVDGARVVGQTGAMLEPLKFGAAATRVAWSVDTYVLPEYRGQGLGHRLQQANQEHHRVFISLAMSEQNRRIKASLGGCSLPGLQVFELRRAYRHAPVPRPLGRLLTAVAAWRWRRRSHAARNQLRRLLVTEVSRFDERFDEFWKAHRERYDVTVERTSQYLNWKFCEQPHAAYRRLAVERLGELAGYVVFRAPAAVEPSLAIIADVVPALQGRPGWTDLVVLAVDRLGAAKAEKVRVGTSQADCAAGLRQLGFRPTRRYTPMCHAADLTIGQDASTLLGLGDHDVDQFPLRK